MTTPPEPSSAARPEAPRLFVLDGAALSEPQRRQRRTRASSLSPRSQQLSLFFSPAQLVFEFHSSFGLTIGSEPALPHDELSALRLSLIEEEVGELRQALASHSLIGTVDALADIVYVTYGAAICFGVDLDAALTEVHRSNLTKLGPDGKAVYRPDGKVLKGPDYEPPDLIKVVASMRKASLAGGYEHIPGSPAGAHVTKREAG